MNTEITRKARQLLHYESYGVLATHSNSITGYPFGSIVPYIYEQNGYLIIYISELTEHTKNLRKNDKCSLTIKEGNFHSDVQTAERLTWIGNAEEVDAGEYSYFEKKYFRNFPWSKKYEETHDFSFWKIDLIRARFIGGFGEIYWLESREFILEASLTNSDLEGAINHMNEDHQRAHRHYLKLVYGLSVDVNSEVSMVDLDPEGFVLHYEKVRYRFFFEKQATNMKEIRKELVRMAHTPIPDSSNINSST